MLIIHSFLSIHIPYETDGDQNAGKLLIKCDTEIDFRTKQFTLMYMIPSDDS